MEPLGGNCKLIKHINVLLLTHGGNPMSQVFFHFADYYNGLEFLLTKSFNELS